VKRIVGVIFAALLLTSVAAADSLPTCSGNGISYTSLMASSGCEIGDYEFTNFAIVSGTMDTDMDAVTATFSYSTRNQTSTIDLHDANGFITDFTISYVVTLDVTVAPANGDPGMWYMTEATAGLQDNPGQNPSDSATWTKSVLALAGAGWGSQTVTDTNGIAVPGPAITTITASTLAVTDAFEMNAVGNGDILDLSNKYYQDYVAPEPSTMILLGAALSGLGFLARKHRRSHA